MIKNELGMKLMTHNDNICNRILSLNLSRLNELDIATVILS